MLQALIPNRFSSPLGLVVSAIPICNGWISDSSSRLNGPWLAIEEVDPKTKNITNKRFFTE